MGSFQHGNSIDFNHLVRTWGMGFISTGFSFFLLYLSQPPSGFPEAAYFFTLPLLIWFYFSPSKKVVLVAVFFGGFLYHAFLIGWLRHVTFTGMLLASVILTLYNLPWFLLAYRSLRIAIDSSFFVRLLLITGLASSWVLIEWIRSLFSLGFPWCPLSVTQWERPAILQLVPYFGGWIVSFFLIFFNLCLSSYVYHLLVRRWKNRQSNYLSSLCPEFYICMAFFLAMLSPLFITNSNSKDTSFEKFKVGVCQPYLKDKWSGENILTHKRTLIEQTKLLSTLEPDLIVWPEASTPYPVNLDRDWVEKLSKDVDVPILAGAIIREEELSYNAVAMITPDKGLQGNWYAKRTLVPFGEYVPFPFSFIPGLSRMVGPVGHFTFGKTIHAFDTELENESKISIFPLICYEDIFPSLVSEINAESNSLLFVTTNDAWFGEEGCAEQHAAHSVIRALESGLPVLRCGNAGWSGWISPKGVVMDLLEDESGDIHFSGATMFDVKVDEYTQTLYSRFGNFFVALCVFFIIVQLYIFHKKVTASPNVTS